MCFYTIHIVCITYLYLLKMNHFRAVIRYVCCMGEGGGVSKVNKRSSRSSDVKQITCIPPAYILRSRYASFNPARFIRKWLLNLHGAHRSHAEIVLIVQLRPGKRYNDVTGAIDCYRYSAPRFLAAARARLLKSPINRMSDTASYTKAEALSVSTLTEHI